MKINPSMPFNAYKKNVPAPVKTSEKALAGSKSNTDTLDFNPAAPSSKVDSGDSLLTARATQIKALVDSGNYNVSSGAIADSILKSFMM